MTRSSRFQIVQAIVVVLLLSVIISGNARATKARTNAARLRTLEAQVAGLNQKLGAASERIETLEDLTQLLDQEGTYYGYVNSAQVWSNYCEPDTPATWQQVEGIAELSCDIPAAEEAPPASSDSSSPEAP